MCSTYSRSVMSRPQCFLLSQSRQTHPICRDVHIQVRDPQNLHARRSIVAPLLDSFRKFDVHLCGLAWCFDEHIGLCIGSLDALARYFEELRLDLASNEFSTLLYSGNPRGPASHERVKDGFGRRHLFKTPAHHLDGLLRWVVVFSYFSSAAKPEPKIPNHFGPIELTAISQFCVRTDKVDVFKPLVPDQPSALRELVA